MNEYANGNKRSESRMNVQELNPIIWIHFPIDGCEVFVVQSTFSLDDWKVEEIMT